MIFSAMISLTLQRKHLLNALLSLEVMVLGLYTMMVATFLGEDINLFLTFIILTFGACEASVGLALLVALIRNHGNDFVSSMSIHKC
uniref:NADH-ubiquinone oxidoreductase chain 4L n=1 Tax=Magelona mirabilis TaxID=46598 RepID=A0A0S2N0D8_9ANNE|nr:NADH dehydrogenase subunit 4L [Magelona mirabilis]ALO81681.1 NADH dehydrogenase subunit 4L [Magelona mirabilis]